MNKKLIIIIILATAILLMQIILKSDGQELIYTSQTSRMTNIQERLVSSRGAGTTLAVSNGVNDFPTPMDKLKEEFIWSSTRQDSGINTIKSVITYWAQKTAYIKCNMGDYYSTGSGTVLKDQDNGNIIVVSNNHVMMLNTEYSAPGGCIVGLPGNDFEPNKTGNSFYQTGIDLASAIIPNPDDNMLAVTKKAGVRVCDNGAEFGDIVVILGYPSIGAQDGLTVTGGMVSGYDDGHFITDAKVEQGNSGGVAVLVKDNCFLGIPTFVKYGELESLARIMDVRRISR